MEYYGHVSILKSGILNPLEHSGPFIVETWVGICYGVSEEEVGNKTR